MTRSLRGAVANIRRRPVSVLLATGTIAIVLLLASAVYLATRNLEVATARWGARYDRRSGLVRFEDPQRLKAEVSPVTPRHRRDRHIAYFLHRNPGHEAGDELVCLAPLSEANLTRAGRRLLVPQVDADTSRQGVPA